MKIITRFLTIAALSWASSIYAQPIVDAGELAEMQKAEDMDLVMEFQDQVYNQVSGMLPGHNLAAEVPFEINLSRRVLFGLSYIPYAEIRVGKPIRVFGSPTNASLNRAKDRILEVYQVIGKDEETYNAFRNLFMKALLPDHARATQIRLSFEEGRLATIHNSISEAIENEDSNSLAGTFLRHIYDQNGMIVGVEVVITSAFDAEDFAAILEEAKNPETLRLLHKARLKRTLGAPSQDRGTGGTTTTSGGAS